MAALCFGHASLRSGHAARRSSWKGVDERDNRRANRRPAERPKGVRFVRRRRTRRLRDQGRRVLLTARPLRLWQDDPPQDDRRLRAAVCRCRPARRRRRLVGAAAQAQRQHGVPAVRAVPAPLDRRQRRLRPPLEEGAGDRVAHAVDGDARRRQAHRVREPAPQPAVGRPAAAGRPGPSARQPAGGTVARRAPRRARPQAPRGDADRAEADPARRRHHLRVRHPRSR